MIFVATRFVDLALKHKPWDKVSTLPADDVKTLLDLVSAAGFEPKEVVPGCIVIPHADEEKAVVNNNCHFKVLDEDEKNHWQATAWLDQALRHVVLGANQKDTPREQLIEEIRIEIEKSIPLEPIQITSEGDLIGEYPPEYCGFGSLTTHSRDHNTLGTCVHKYCNGWVDRKRVTKTNDALVCRACHMRVLFPMEIKTFGELRQALAQRVKTPV